MLGSYIGDSTSTENFIHSKVAELSSILEVLSNFAASSPQNVFCCMNLGVQNKMSFSNRVTPGFHHMLHEAESVIHNKMIPALTNRDIPNENERKLFSLPIKDGGLNLRLPEDYCKDYIWSQLASMPLEDSDPINAELCQRRITYDIRHQKKQILKEKLHNIKSNLNEAQRYAIELAAEKGSSSWLNAIPQEKYNFNLNKREFRDGLALRYSWEHKYTPSVCPCGQAFSLCHALNCNKGGYIILR